jgi:hypothetical protein
MAASSPATRTADSSDRTPVIAAGRSGPSRKPATPTNRSGGFGRRFLSALMRSLAAPHI